MVGRSDGPLELYLVADRSPADYLRLEAPGADVRPFTLAAPGRNGQGGPVARLKLDLVQGATVWYTVEAEAPAQAPHRPGV